MNLKWKISLWALSISALLVWLIALSWPNSQVKVIFCDVGQGDAILVQLRSTQILIDGGPGRKVLDCLSRHLPFWDREIELVVLTHPQADHMNGLLEIFPRYEVSKFVTGVEGNETAGYRQLMKLIEQSKQDKPIKIGNVYAGDIVRIYQSQINELTFEVVWPERKWVEDHLAEDKSWVVSSGIGVSGGGGVLGAKTDGTDLNSFSIGLELHYGNFQALFTGDADMQIEDEMISAGHLNDIDLLKVPHHGSKTGMTPEWLELVDPELAVISVGKTNSYGHPRAETMKLLSDRGTKFLRTDLDGEVVIESDGQKWAVASKGTSL